MILDRKGYFFILWDLVLFASNVYNSNIQNVNSISSNFESEFLNDGIGLLEKVTGDPWVLYIVDSQPESWVSMFFCDDELCGGTH